MQSDYTKLMDKAKTVTLLQSTSAIVHWDMETKMPPKGIILRSNQLALLSEIEHKMITDPDTEILLEKIEKHPDYNNLDALQKRNIYLIRKNYDEQNKLPKKLVSETERQKILTINIWKKAKAAKKFSLLKPDLEKLVNFKKRTADILMEVKGTATPYDALIDIYEPKMNFEIINRLFKELKKDLISIIEKCQSSSNKPDTSILQRRIPIDIQHKISKLLVKFLNYDIESDSAGGRIDETEHPFTTGYYDDVRITTHYYNNNFISSIFSTLHESGHAIYEQNLNQKWIYQPIGASCSLGLHESQSRFIENIIGRSYNFWTYFLPKLKECAVNIFSDIDLQPFVFVINKVKPSKIRVEADEVTYCLHVIIRFEIERDLINDKITVAELPEIWNQKYKEYLDVDIKNDSEGVMQDIHWASGAIGYFPTYALGNIYSGQILFNMQKKIPDWKKQIAKGNFNNVKNWLTKNVYHYGNLYDPTDLIKKITGEEISVKHYLDYLHDKFSKLYEF